MDNLKERVAKAICCPDGCMTEGTDNYCAAGGFEANAAAAIAAIPQAGDAGEMVERLEARADTLEALGRENRPLTSEHDVAAVVLTREILREAATTIRTLQARLDVVREEEREAINHARRLAVALWEKHFREQSPEWKPLPDLFGLIDQIDNMTTAMTAIRERTGE